MNRNENQMIIKALNMYGRVPETWELLKEIERLNKALLDIKEILKKEYEWNEDRYIDIVDIVNKALGSDKE